MGPEGLNGVAIDLGRCQGIDGLAHWTIYECGSVDNQIAYPGLSG